MAKNFGLHSDASYKRKTGGVLDERQKIVHALIRNEITDEECKRRLAELGNARRAK